MKEIGGYFGFEKLISNEYHKGLVGLNTARNAFLYLLRAKEIRKVYIPYYVCDSVVDILLRNGYEFEYYHVNSEFIPVFNKILYDNEYLYIVNYYGQLTKEKILDLKQQFGRIILDNTHAFFQDPLDGIDTIYSCRKFFGVPDGAYLSTGSKLSEKLNIDISKERMAHILGRYEGIASDYYSVFQEIDTSFKSESLKYMSKLTQNILGAIDYKKVLEIRNENYAYLDSKLSRQNKLKLITPDGAFAYPFYIKNGIEIRKQLARKKVYIPTLWPNALSNTQEDSIEHDYVSNILPLPCDQRYSIEDMKYMIKEIGKFDEKVNTLIFPAGSENAINIYDSLKYNLHFNVFGASGKADHAEFIYPKVKLFIGDLYITEKNFVDEFNKVIEMFKIDYIIPTHDTIALYLTEHYTSIDAKIICSPYETTRIAENKKLTYDYLKNAYFYPKVFNSINEIKKYPVFLKPYVGAGGKGTYLVKNNKELEMILEKDSSLLISEYLPGREYTVDCFTNKNGELLFVGPRTRERITIGITFHSVRPEDSREFKGIAEELNNRFKFRGAWFFQVKEDEFGCLKLMEFSVRQGGTMVFYRQLGVNYAALSVFDAMGYDVKILFNDYKLILDRTLKNSYRFDYEYEKLYIDFDDTLIIDDKVNTTLMKLIYQSINADKKVILLTKHIYNLDESLKRYRINKDLFDEIIKVEPNSKKAEYIDNSKAIFIDNYFPERLSVKKLCNIPVFDVDAVECLIDSTAL